MKDKPSPPPRVQKDWFKNVKHKLHNKNDDDCICPGCIRVLEKIADEFVKEYKRKGIY